MMEISYELGGFAEFPEDIDGTERDLEAFNYCLAEEYVNSMFAEDFELLGQVSYDLLEKICYWLNYNGTIGDEEEIKQIGNGTFKTVNNRTFIEAIFDNKNACLAEAYIFNEVYDPKLILTVILDETDSHIALIQPEKTEEIENIINRLYEEIEKQFVAENDKVKFLNKIKEGIHKVKISNKFKSKPISSYNYSWVKAMKKGSV